MAAITRIDVFVKTANVLAAETHSRVYLGIAGREFRLSTGSANDFGRHTETTFVLGVDSNVQEGTYVDPRFPQLTTDDLDRYPAYLRHDGEGDQPAWCLERAMATVNPHSEIKHRFDNPNLVEDAENRRIWLDDKYGNVLHLKRYVD